MAERHTDLPPERPVCQGIMASLEQLGLRLADLKSALASWRRRIEALEGKLERVQRFLVSST